MMFEEIKEGKTVKKGHFVFSPYIWVQRKGKKKYEKMIRVSNFVDQVSKGYAKHKKVSLNEAKKIVNRALFANPYAILETLQSADKRIEGWKIPSKIKWNKKKKMEKVI